VPRASGLKLFRHIVAVRGRETLANLDAAPVAMHIAKAADVHQDVEAELLSGTESTRHLIMLAAVAEPEFDDLAMHLGAKRVEFIANLAIRIVTVLIKQRGSQFQLKRIVVQQIDELCFLDGTRSHQLGGSLPQFL